MLQWREQEMQVLRLRLRAKPCRRARVPYVVLHDSDLRPESKQLSASEDETVVMHPEPAHGHGGTETSTAALPTVSNTTLIFFAAGVLVVFLVALVTLLG